MSDPLAAAKLKAETAYNAAADFYDAEPLGFWARSGRRTVERLRLRPGAHVLDVCCGTGASALPAARWGSGLRWTIDQMGIELAREVKHEIIDRLGAAGVDRVETNVIYAIAQKPPGPA